MQYKARCSLSFFDRSDFLLKLNLLLILKLIFLMAWVEQEVNIYRIPVYTTFHHIRPNQFQTRFLLLYKEGLEQSVAVVLDDLFLKDIFHYSKRENKYYIIKRIYVWEQTVLFLPIFILTSLKVEGPQSIFLPCPIFSKSGPEQGTQFEY